MRVLLTGATGLIGSRVLERLLARGDAVNVLALPETLELLPVDNHLNVIKGDLDNTAALKQATDGVDIVYHVAGLIAGSSPQQLVRVNVQGTENLLNASVASGVGRFVYTSSVSVYSPAPYPFMWPITEDSPLKAHGSEALKNYGQSKIDAEGLVQRTQREEGLEYVIIRPPTVYGSGAHFVLRMIDKIMTRPLMALRGNGQLGYMQWLHVDDLADAIVMAGTRPGAANQVFNVAGGEIITAPTIAATILEKERPDLGIDARRYQVSSPGNYGMRFDISKAQEKLGFTPQVKFQHGLLEMLAEADEADEPHQPHELDEPAEAEPQSLVQRWGAAAERAAPARQWRPSALEGGQRRGQGHGQGRAQGQGWEGNNLTQQSPRHHPRRRGRR
ncbi:MAG TPA: NAD(P)-dependent oxidoreductase [Pyrinomonadaceae bacterium]|jgi:nucleoside-diphosphate-sugar epimerase|nr:NAD(P)-dependent oxidoreductase [Pyrinomonadaceae bacterium]